jgi:hypothetical protein
MSPPAGFGEGVELLAGEELVAHRAGGALDCAVTRDQCFFEA